MEEIYIRTCEFDVFYTNYFSHGTEAVGVRNGALIKHGGASTRHENVVKIVGLLRHATVHISEIFDFRFSLIFHDIRCI